MHVGDRKRPPLSPREGWLSDGREVLHFRRTLWDRWSQRLEITSGELPPDQAVLLLKRRWELSRIEALRLWAEKREQGWQPTTPQWQPPASPAQGCLSGGSVGIAIRFTATPPAHRA